MISHVRTVLACATIVGLLVLTSCGGSDDSAGDSSSSGSSGGGEAASSAAAPADVASCLDAAGHPVEVSTLFTEDQMDAFGIEEVLGWSFSEAGFLGSITFFEDEGTARESQEALAAMAEQAEAAGLNVAERYGVAVIDMTGGTQEALDAARDCLSA